MGGRRDSLAAARHASATARAAAGQATAPGRSDTSSDSAPSGPKHQSVAITQREGRQSIETADPLDEGVELGVVGMFEPHEPAPEPIVLAIQQASEDGAFGFGGLRPVLVEETGEQLVELAHAAARTPAQLPEFGVAFAQPWRASINCLISAIALAGLSPFGQVRVQFMMVWQR